MSTADSFQIVLKSLADSESLIEITVLGRDESIRGKITQIGGDYIKIKPEGPTGGRVFFIRFGAIGCIDTTEPLESKPVISEKQEEDTYRISRRTP